MIGWALRLLVIWGGLGLLLYAVIGHRLSMLPHATAPVPTASAPADAPASGALVKRMTNSLVYRADRQGHVELNGTVNGTMVRFVVDTGATFVSLTLADARAVGFGPNDLNFNIRTSTANGVARAAAVTLRELRIGQFSVYDVPALVGENLGVSLLGQSFLTRLDSYEMRDGVLTLNWN